MESRAFAVMQRILQIAIVSAAVMALLEGCGSSGSSSSNTRKSSSTAGGQTSTSSANDQLAEQQSAAAGDIPDNQVYLRYRDSAAGYSVLYPEGWLRQGGGNDIAFSDKSNAIHIRIATAPAPTTASVGAELTRLKRSDPALSFTPPKAVSLKSGPALRSTYTTKSKPNSVTGKTLLLDVDRYELAHAGKLATIDLARAKGVDTADAYRMIINSFRWQ